MRRQFKFSPSVFIKLASVIYMSLFMVGCAAKSGYQYAPAQASSLTNQLQTDPNSLGSNLPGGLGTGTGTGTQPTTTTTLPGNNPFIQVPAQTGPDPLQVYFDSLYVKILNRHATSQEIANLTTAYQSNGLYNVVLGILTSQERSQNLANSYYQNLLGRAADAGGLNYWTGIISSQGERGGLAGFFASNEYYTRVGNSTGAFVSSLYNVLLRQQPDQNGYTAWVNAINGGTPRVNAAWAFLDSDQFRAGVLIPTWYQSFLGMPADAQGATNLLNYLKNGATWAQLEAYFFVSKHYLDNLFGTGSGGV